MPTTLKVFSQEYVDYLRRGVKDGALLNLYKNKLFEIDDKNVLTGPSIHADVDLKFIPVDLSDKPKNDYDNAIAIYSAYKNLTPLQASDIRLWVYLAHSPEGYSYLRARWPNLDTPTSSYIAAHWLISSPSQGNLMRHGLAGLWWGAYLSHDPERKNPFELTRILFRQLDFATRTLGTYSLSRHKEAVLGILEYINENESLFEERFESKSRMLTKFLNRLGGTRPLSYLDKTFFRKNLEYLSPRFAAIG